MNVWTFRTLLIKGNYSFEGVSNVTDMMCIVFFTRRNLFSCVVSIMEVQLYVVLMLYLVQFVMISVRFSLHT